MTKDAKVSTPVSKRDFLKKAGLVTAGAAAATVAAPHVARAAPIKWRLQTYAGPALAEHVVTNSINVFNKAANGEMEIELFTADQLVPQGELFRAVQAGTIDAAQSDDDSAAAPVDVRVFAAYFPFASRYSLDVPTLWEWYGLKEIWEEAYSEVPNVTWLSTGSWDPCNFATTKPIRSVEDLKGLRVYMFPTGGQFMQQFGVVPVSLPYEDVQPAIQTGELDGICLVRHYRVLHRGLGRRHQILSDQQHLRRVGRVLFRQHRKMEGSAAASAAAVQDVHRLVALLPAALVLVGRGALPHHRRQAGVDHHPRRRMEDRRGQGHDVLGRDCQDQPALRQGRGDPQEIQRDHGEGRSSLPLRLGWQRTISTRAVLDRAGPF